MSRTQSTARRPNAAPLHRLLLPWLAVACLAAPGPARAVLEITIEEGVIETLPLAVIPFTRAQGEVEDLAAVVTADLHGSGYFDIPPAEKLPYLPEFGSPIQFADWRRLGLESLLVGKLHLAPDGTPTLEFRLYDTYRELELAGYRLTGFPGRLRELAHRVSDLVFERLTGRPGFFSTRIVYVVTETRPDGRHHSLYVADYDGAGRVAVVDSTQPLLSPDWSPDGKQLAYSSLGEQGTRVHVLELASGRDRELPATPGLNTAPSWSPDGEHLALVLSKDGNAEIYVLHLGSGLLQRITKHPAIDTEPSWDSRGEYLLFTSDRSGGPQIYIIPARGGSPRRLTFDGRYNAQAALSQDGKRLALIHGDSKSFQVALQDLDSGILRVLTESNLYSAVAFSPGGELLICAGREAAQSYLALVSLDGRVQRRLLSITGKISDPDWGPIPTP